MKTEIQRRIENLVTDNRGYLKIPTSRLFGNKRALRKWLEFSEYREETKEIIENYEYKYKELKKEFCFPLNLALPKKLHMKKDEIDYDEYYFINYGTKMMKVISFFIMIPKSDFSLLYNN